ncbi:MAG: hypothetical protein NWQ39_11695, partial [Saprospiraceae bacterium]|nr:hypothetical protein [Saprospiraceae bacterium]
HWRFSSWFDLKILALMRHSLWYMAIISFNQQFETKIQKIISKIPNHWEKHSLYLGNYSRNCSLYVSGCDGDLSANLKPFLTLVHRADNQVCCSRSPTAPCARSSGCEKT